MLEEVLNTSVFRLHLVMCHHSKQRMEYFKLLDSSRMICLIFQNNYIDNISSKRQKRHRLITFIFVNTIQYPHTLQNNIYHSNKWGPLPFFHSDINPVLGHFLVYCVGKTHILIVIVELIWLLFLNILSFNFAQTPSKSLKLPCCCSNQSFTAFLYEAFSRRKTTNYCCYSLTSSSVNTVKELCSR